MLRGGTGNSPRMPDTPSSDSNQATVETIAHLAADQDLTVAVAESLTSGAIASALGAGPSAASWFAGGVVAYQEPVKFELLGVPEGPVVTAECATAMASGVRRLTGADVAVAVTGVGGPDPSEGKPAGTVWIAVDRDAGANAQEVHLDGEPEQVLDGTVRVALDALAGALRGR